MGIGLLTVLLPPLKTAAQTSPAMQKRAIVDTFIEKSNHARAKYNFIDADLYLDSALIQGAGSINESDLANLYLNKGVIKNNLNDFGVALEFLFNAKSSFEKLKDWNKLVATYVNIAEFYRKTGGYSDAKEFIEKALTIYEKHQVDDLILLNKIYNRSAAINNESNPDPSYSLKDSRKALALAKQLSIPDLMAVSYNEMGFTYKNLKKVDSSEIFYREAERIWMEQGKYQEALHAMANRAQFYQHNNYPENQFVNLYKRIVFLTDSLGVNYPLMNISWALYNLYLEKGDTSLAYRYFRMHHDESMEFYNLKTRSELHNVRARFKNEEIRSQYQAISHELSQSSKNLEQKRKQQFILVIALSILGILLVLIGYLFFRLRVSNAILSDKNKEKDTLIQEIHHRVKNNLQFISSLINMQVKNTDNEKETDSLLETSRRINAMALVHEMLYNSADQEGISLKYYLEELIDSLYTLVNSDNQHIEIEMDILDIQLNVSDTISLGMITSELISNSMKHAFKKTAKPKISIQLIKEEKGEHSYTYTVRDNGSGFPKNLNPERSLGLRLVDIFSRQLKGSYEIAGSKGFVYTLKFSIN
jgi:two-component sensor histidine kinase